MSEEADLAEDCKTIPENCNTNSALSVDCKDLHENGHSNSGVYDIYPYGDISRPVKVYCDMETMEGGWTAIQKRVDGSVYFGRKWADYKNGFGSPEKNIWIGNDVIHQLTKGRNTYLYVSITHEEKGKLYQIYDQFYVSNETEKYQLFLTGNSTGTLGDKMRKKEGSPGAINGMFFTTIDKDNDNFARNCAIDQPGGWWFNRCGNTFLNGPWATQHWYRPWNPLFISGEYIKETMMLIKRH
ncbi:fibroleukin-like [Saccostrea echinata]|uniref:fibroleukin-like n=1 Tax=Saccostrea echinata TaxID=191078 RepID=UPI002A833563|nr:fibroleukin-like [Saccostrea echinata]